MFDSKSRYFALPTAAYAGPGEEQLIYKTRRFLPRYTPQAGDRIVVVAPGDRLDTIAARMFGDPLQYWRILDAADALNPFEAVKPGTKLVVPALGFGSGPSS